VAPKARTLPPPPPPEPPATIEERYAKLQARLGQTSEDFRGAYEENFIMSWIHHDSALEGVVYTYEELRTAVNPNVTVVPDSSLQSVCEEIRRHKQAIEVVRELGERKRQPATLDQLKRIFLTLHPEEGDLKTVRYRKEIPQHRMYFHEYAAPDKIPYKVRQVFDWLNGPEPKKLKSPLRVAGRVHYDLLRIFPFAKDSGKVARLFMNMLLLRADYPPAILHSTERQRYYEALKGSPNTICNMLESAILNALQSIEKQLGTQDTRLRAIVS
jgi:Fic family protein